MTTIIEKYKPSRNELIKIKELSKDCPELLEIFEEAEYRLDKIMKIICELEDNNPLKEIFKNAIPALNALEMEKNTFKFLAHKFQEERNIAINKGLEYKNALKKTAERHNDFTDLKELNRKFSLVQIESKQNLSKWRNKSISEFLTSNQNLNQLFDKEIILDKDKLDELKGEDKRKGPRINDIERVSIINKNIISDKDDVKVINKIKK